MTISAAIGALLPAALRRKCRELRLICDFLNEMSVLMQFRASHIRTITDELCSRESFRSCVFLRNLHSAMTDCCDIQELWRITAQNAAFLSDDEKSILVSVGDSLGASDTEGQKAMLGAQCDELGRRLSEAEKEYRKKGKLAASVCPLLGIGLTVMLI